MKKDATIKGESPSRLIDARIKELNDWRGKMLSHVRALIKQADPAAVEEWKWRATSGALSICMRVMKWMRMPLRRSYARLQP
jgi:hypothetical protein